MKFTQLKSSGEILRDTHKFAGSTIKKSKQRTGEPGIKLPTKDYKQIGQFCEKCDDVKTHFIDIETSTRLCAYCGYTTSIKQATIKIEKIKIVKKEESPHLIGFSYIDLFIKV